MIGTIATFFLELVEGLMMTPNPPEDEEGRTRWLPWAVVVTLVTLIGFLVAIHG